MPPVMDRMTELNPAAKAFAGAGAFAPKEKILAVANPPPLAPVAPTPEPPPAEAPDAVPAAGPAAAWGAPPPSEPGAGWQALKQTSGPLGQRLDRGVLSSLASQARLY